MKTAAALGAIVLVVTVCWLANRRYGKVIEDYSGPITAIKGEPRLILSPCALPLYERLDALYEDWRQRREDGDCPDLLPARDRGESQAALTSKRGVARDWIRRNPPRPKPMTVGIVRRLRAVR